MTPRYRRVEPTRVERAAATLAACAVAAATGLVTYYLSRVMLSRQPVGVRRADATSEPDER